MNISLIEYIAYAIVAYSGIIVLIASTLKENPTTRSLAIVRGMYMIPCAIANFILAQTGVNITWVTQTTTNTIKALNTSQLFTENSTQTNQFVLVSPVWSMFHYMLGIILIFYVIQQMLFLLVRPARQGPSDEYEP